jgi:hypothetical protein
LSGRTFRQLAGDPELVCIFAMASLQLLLTQSLQKGAGGWRLALQAGGAALRRPCTYPYVIPIT